MKYYPKPVRMATVKKPQIINVDENVEKMEPWYTDNGNANLYSHYEKQHEHSQDKLKIELQQDSTIHSWLYTESN